MNKVQQIKQQIADYVGVPIEEVKRNSRHERFRLKHGDFSVFDQFENKERHFRITGWQRWMEINRFIKSNNSF